LPSVPAVPTPNTNPNSTFTLPKIPEAPAAPTAASATVDGKNQQAVKTAEAPPTNSVADKPPVDPEGAMADSANSKASDSSSLPPQGLPNLPLPNSIAMPDASITPPSLPTAAVSLPEINVEKAKPKVATWQTKLAPSIIPPQTNFNYKRVQLPDSIYATQYDRDNSHLPIRVTREDYEALLFTMVAKNDIDATRALLNAGTGLEVTNSYGETPLTVARRSGATEVAELLVARGAK
jgi:hypothetical protein